MKSEGFGTAGAIIISGLLATALSGLTLLVNREFADLRSWKESLVAASEGAIAPSIATLPSEVLHLLETEHQCITFKEETVRIEATARTAPRPDWQSLSVALPVISCKKPSSKLALAPTTCTSANSFIDHSLYIKGNLYAANLTLKSAPGNPVFLVVEGELQVQNLISLEGGSAVIALGKIEAKAVIPSSGTNLLHSSLNNVQIAQGVPQAILESCALVMRGREMTKETPASSCITPETSPFFWKARTLAVRSP